MKAETDEGVNVRVHFKTLLHLSLGGIFSLCTDQRNFRPEGENLTAMQVVTCRIIEQTIRDQMQFIYVWKYCSRLEIISLRAKR